VNAHHSEARRNGDRLVGHDPCLAGRRAFTIIERAVLVPVVRRHAPCEQRVSEAGDSIRRRRRCTGCQKRFTTYETVELRLPQVVKSNGERAEFDTSRLRVGFARALHKRPVPTEFVDAAIDRIVQRVLSLGEREIASRQLGEMVMEELYKLDKVAYIRFASVYRSFQDVSDFRDALKEVEAVPLPRKGARRPA